MTAFPKSKMTILTLTTLTTRHFLSQKFGTYLFFSYLCTIFISEANVKAEAEGWGYIYRKGVYYGALFFDSLNVSQTKRVSQKQSNGGCPRDM